MERHKAIFFTGAGISVDSGIPTFQEQPGIRDKLHRSFANEHPEEYRETIRQMLESCDRAEPNAAHVAIAELNVPVITMNVDGLHEKAGSKNVIPVHGKLPTWAQLAEKNFPSEYDGIVLYGDMAPKYEEAMQMVDNLAYEKSYFIIVGTSFYTGISQTLHHIARQRHAQIVIINEDATHRVPAICKNIKDFLK